MMEQTGLKMYRFPDTKVWKFLFAAFFFVMLLFSRDTMITGAIVGVETAQYINLVLMLIAGISFLLINRKVLKSIFTDVRMLLIIASTVVILLPMFVKRDWQLMYFSVLMCVLFPVFLSFFVSYRDIVKIFLCTICFLSIYSVITLYLIKPFCDSGLFNVPVINSSTTQHLNFGVSFPRNWKSYYRNFGVFREPGVYQFFILLSLYTNNYLVFWNRTWVKWIIDVTLVITMFSTFSTGGIIELCLLFAVVFVDRRYYADRKIRRSTFMLLLIFFLFIAYAIIAESFLYNTLRNMIVKLFNFDPYSSGGARYDAIITDIKIFFEKPFWGEKLAVVLHAVEHNTTSTMLMFSIFGIFGGLFHVAGWVAFVWEKNRKTWVNLALLVIMFMSFNTQNLIADVFFWLFPMMALVEKWLPLMKLDRANKRV